MKKTLLPLVAALVAIGGAPAASAKVVSHTVQQKPSDVRAYWTDERMRGAIPAARTRGGAPVERAKPGSGGGGWTGGSFNWTNAAPMSYTNGKVFFTDDGSNYVCSGTAVQSGNDSVVWTAGHCVHDGPGSFHYNWTFVPGYHNGSRPKGTWVAEYLYTSSGWADSGEFGYDFGAARVYPNGTATMNATIGAERPVATDAGAASAQLTSRRDSFGYPAAGKFNGQTLRYCDSYVSRTDSNSSPATMGMPCDMTGGSSGGGWIDDQLGSLTRDKLVSVNSYGYGSLRNVMFGPVLGAEAAAVLGAADGGSGAPASSQLPR
jgi:hypothetical protein